MPFYWPTIVGVSAVGLSLLLFIRFRYRSPKMRAAAMATATNLRGKIAVITGSSSGLGREVAFQLAKRRMDVVLACRDRSKAEKAVEFIENRLKNEHSSSLAEIEQSPFGKLHIMDLNLADLSSVASFARKFEDQFANLHLLVNNAGIMACPYSTSRGGLIELHFAVNHLGHFHLTNLLLPILKRSAPSRILIVTSGYYRKLARPTTEGNLFDQVASGKEPGYEPLKAYARSKLANCLHAVELAKRLTDVDVQVFTVRPGFVRGTELGRHFNQFLTALATPLIWMFSQTVEQAAETYLYCALAEKSADLKSGTLYYNCSQQAYLENLVNEERASALWALSESLVTSENEAIERLLPIADQKEED